PVKELIDWDQQRLDVEIKYDQVVEQFTAEVAAPAELQALVEVPELPAEGKLRATGLTLVDEGGARVLEGVSFEIGRDEHVAVVGRQGSSELARLMTRLMPPTGGSLELGGLDLVRAPEAVTGRAFSYVGSPAYLFPASVRDNIVYGLKHAPLREAEYEGDAARQRELDAKEAERTGNCPLDISADWIDYAAAG